MKGLVRVDVGLIVASVAVLAVGFDLTVTSAGLPMIGLGSTEPQAEPTEVGAIYPNSFNLAIAGGSQIPDRPGVSVGRGETEFALAVERADRTPKPSSDDPLCSTFNERFYFDQQTDSFDDRFGSAFGSSRNTARDVATADEPQQLDFKEHSTGEPVAIPSAPNPVTTSRHASIRKERLNTAEASLSMSLPLDSGNRTAIYEIATRTVYLPNGDKLEAHSGLGSYMDDAHYVNTKMQGPTPPNVYNLSLRERLFHGVRAIRLVPVDDGKMFGRDGILAHPYMLGPNGQSNGCVSFRNYPAFLNAFLKGDVDRLVVVEHLVTTSAKARTASGG